jgi:7,8-dihydroneopterin aldolase/epimerase/oxygenase
VDRIEIRGIRVQARHGASAREREREQTFVIDVLAEIDLTEPAASDDIDATMHYGRLYERVTEIARGRSYALLERLASDLIEAVFVDPRVARAEVTIAKPGLLEGATPSVTLARPNRRYAGNY